MSLKHGHASNGRETPEYKAWKNMRRRCENPNHPRYKDWGGRGIKVCERWHDFRNFYADMGPKPGPEFSLDRKNNNGNYEPENCRWATRSQQQRNARPKSTGPHRQRWFLALGPRGESVISNNQRKIAKKYGLTFQAVSACLHGKLLQHHGWHFEWIKGGEINVKRLKKGGKARLAHQRLPGWSEKKNQG